jgi:NHL repeat
MSRNLVATLAASILTAIAPWWLTTEATAQSPAQTHTRELPVFEVDPTWPRLPPQWKVGDVSQINADSQGNVYLLHRPRTLKAADFARAAPPVLVFDRDGNFLRGWGGDGSGYEWPQREHGIYLDPKGFAWIGGNSCPTPNGQQRLSFVNAPGRSCGDSCSTDELPRLKPVTDDQLLKFTADGKFVMQIGHSNQSRGNADTDNLHRPTDVHYYTPTNEIFVSDGYGNHRVVVFDADSGAFKRMWGAFGNKPQDDDHCEIVAKDDASSSGPSQFNIVHSLRVSNDGMVYVADRENRRVQSFTLAGAFVKQLRQRGGPRAASVAFSPDPEQKFLYVGNSDDIALVDRKSLEVVGTIKPPGSIGGGHMIGTDRSGNLYVASPARGAQKLVFKGMTEPAVRR